MTYLHNTSLMSRFLHVEFNISICRAQPVLHIGQNQKSKLIFLSKVNCYGILKTVKIANLKAHYNEKMAVKEKEPYFNSI